MKNISQIRSKVQLLHYWQDCIKHLKDKNELQVAYDMVKVAGNDIFQSKDWYGEGGNGDPDVVRIFDLVSSLEVPSEDIQARQCDWELVRDHLNNLAKRV